jgi:molecular chaperone DnaK
MLIVTIAASSGLSDKEIENMVEESEKYAEEDKARKASIEAKNDAENIIGSTEKSMSEFKDQLDKEEESKIRAKIVELRELLNSAEEVDAEAVKAKCGELQSDSLGLFEKVYKSKQAQNGGDSSSSDEPVDAKAEDVKREKKQ